MDLGPSFSYDRSLFEKKPFSRTPFAVVRFTAYDEFYGEPLKVNETLYPNTKKGISDFRGQILAALEAGFDVSIVSRYQIGKIKRLLDFAASQ